jgi:tetratricopeptide (TPR) repeat protein
MTTIVSPRRPAAPGTAAHPVAARFVSAFIIAALSLAATGPVAAQQPADPAQAAWEADDHARARELYAARVAADSGDVQALHRLGLLLAWDRQYAAAIPLLERLVSLAPYTAPRLDLANVLAWSRSYDRALAVLDDVLRTDPSRDVLHTRARFLSWAGRYAEAGAAYRDLLAADADDAEALRGLARVTTWRGDLVGGEAAWRRALAADPASEDAHMGLSQLLRWRGQLRPALEHARTAVGLRPGDRDILEQLAWAEAAFAPRIAPTFSAETDSDDNRLFTMALAASAHLEPRMALTLNATLRRAEGPTPLAAGELSRETRSVSAGARVEVGAGWALSGAGGVVDRPGTAGTAGTRRTATGTYRAGIASPAWLPVAVTASAGRSALDVTADLMGRDIVTDDVSLGIGVQLVPAIRLEAGTALTRFRGETTNDRVLARLGLDARAGPLLRLRPRATAFRFEHAVQEGYFAPDEYVLAELGVGVDRYRGGWSLSGEVAPGAQRIGSSGDVLGAFSARARVAYGIAPGREVGIGLSFSNLGVERFQPGAGGYRYQAAVLSMAWGF